MLLEKSQFMSICTGSRQLSNIHPIPNPDYEAIVYVEYIDLVTGVSIDNRRAWPLFISLHPIISRAAYKLTDWQADPREYTLYMGWDINKAELKKSQFLVHFCVKVDKHIF